MNKKEFMLEYRKKLRIKDLEIIESKVNNFWDSWFEVLKENKKLTIKDFGKFEIKDVKPRKVVSPYGEFITNPSKKISFSVGKEFREMVK
jgi:nucleoid DNA-binding protein